MSQLGFSYRKTPNFEHALSFYQWALRIEPEHYAANEYPGELYLETDQLKKGMQLLETLDGLCSFSARNTPG